jgi:2-oxoglutarate/2-oxoacid ferredoxin oxidoreductase subunit alpha
MNDELTIKIAGEAGQGMQTIGIALCNLFRKSGFYIFANQDYMSRVRGGNNFFQLRIANNPVYTLRQKADIVIALDSKSVELHRADIFESGVLLLDNNKFAIPQGDKLFLSLPFYELANTIGGSDIFIGSVCCGAIAGLTGVDTGRLGQVLKDAFADKGEAIIDKNIRCSKAGYDFIKDNFKQEKFRINHGKSEDSLLMNGNEAIALAAIRAGCKFYCAYPMTPSTSIMDTIAHFSGMFNIVVEQAEDEIAAINMALGASFAGARSMTGTSGGGLSLMVEGISLAGMTETPVVIVDSQRPAPATGFPTRTEQADLNFVIHAGHGEFARVVYAPGTIEEAFYLTVKAFNIAEKYQIPVFILTDQHLADSYRNIRGLDWKRVSVKRSVISKEDSLKVSNYQRYLITGSGVSPRAIPSWIEDVIYVDSDEHNEDGHITEDAGMRIKMVQKRFRQKMAGLSQEIENPIAYNTDKAEVVIISFGSTLGVVKEAVGSRGGIGFIHLPQVWPFPAQDLAHLLKNTKKVLTVENNASAQLAGLLRRETGITVDSSILKFDGRPFNSDYLIQCFKERGL